MLNKPKSQGCFCVTTRSRIFEKLVVPQLVKEFYIASLYKQIHNYVSMIWNTYRFIRTKVVKQKSKHRHILSSSAK